MNPYSPHTHKIDNTLLSIYNDKTETQKSKEQIGQKRGPLSQELDSLSCWTPIDAFKIAFNKDSA